MTEYKREDTKKPHFKADDTVRFTSAAARACCCAHAPRAERSAWSTHMSSAKVRDNTKPSDRNALYMVHGDMPDTHDGCTDSLTSNCTYASTRKRAATAGGKPGAAARAVCDSTCSTVMVHTTNCTVRRAPPASVPPYKRMDSRMPAYVSAATHAMPATR